MATVAVGLAALGGLTGYQREAEMLRSAVLRPHFEDAVPLARAAGEAGVACRTAQRWAAAYRDRSLAGLVRTRRSDAGHRRIPEELRHLIEGLALRRPAQHMTWVHTPVACFWRTPAALLCLLPTPRRSRLLDEQGGSSSVSPGGRPGRSGR
ncbi:leucine zipper domain-containing protein [Streptomyces sp. NPDC000410]|uniref:leucine zipper domain-containing protein n=1 Tax=Streptomyces sp. NPDC000410 TaxID=3154254 RepID=UPI00332DE296